jgi:hypothetical protein
MKYFNLLPTINYGGVYITNLFYRYILDTPIDQKYLFDYKMKYGESLEDIALTMYNNTQLWWVIALINNIYDPFFDILVDDNVIRENAKDQATIDNALDHDKFIEIYDILSNENETKRNIKILTKEHLNSFLSDVAKLSGNQTETDEHSIAGIYEVINKVTFLNFIADDTAIIE